MLSQPGANRIVPSPWRPSAGMNMRHWSICCSATEDQDAVPVLKACGVDLAQLKQELTGFVDSELQSLRSSSPVDPKPTAGFQRVVQRSVIHVQSSGREEVTGANVLVALFSERESHAVYFLQVQDMTVWMP